MNASRPRRDTAQTTEAIVLAASELFLKNGYAQTNLEKVAQHAGVTKPTVYSHFGSKEALLHAVTQRNASQRVATMADALQATDDPREDLLRFANALLGTILSEQSRAWHRFASAAALEHPEVGEAFYCEGPARVIELLKKYLLAQKRDGLMEVANAGRAAEQFLGMLIGLELLRSRIGQPVKSESSLKQHARDCVELFLNTYGVEAQ